MARSPRVLIASAVRGYGSLGHGKCWHYIDTEPKENHPGERFAMCGSIVHTRFDLADEIARRNAQLRSAGGTWTVAGVPDEVLQGLPLCPRCECTRASKVGRIWRHTVKPGEWSGAGADLLTKLSVLFPAPPIFLGELDPKGAPVPTLPPPLTGSDESPREKAAVLSDEEVEAMQAEEAERLAAEKAAGEKD